MTKMVRNACVLFSITLLTVVGLLQTVRAERLRQRGPIVEDPTTMVLDAISQFAFSIRIGAPRISSELWDEAAASPNALGGSQHAFDALIGATSGNDGPILQIICPRVTWAGDIATVRCYEVWNIKFADQKHFYWAGIDEYRVARASKSYKIVSATVTPLVLRYARDRATFERKLSEEAPRMR